MPSSMAAAEIYVVDMRNAPTANQFRHVFDIRSKLV